jgi:hypothetical protein
MFQVDEAAEIFMEELELILGKIETRQLDEGCTEVFLESNYKSKIDGLKAVVFTGRNLIWLLERSSCVARRVAAMSLTRYGSMCSMPIGGRKS